jgi:itaconate CoA-transferase
VAFCGAVLLQPELANDPRFASNSLRNQNRDALRQLIVDSFSGLSSDTVIARLDEAKIANARVNTMHDVWEHPQLQARGRWRQVDSPQGPLPALLPPGQDGSSRMDPIPAVGQHTEAILAGLGFQPAQSEALRSANAI